ncbi:MAG: lytic murein transglycosylase, partial [Luteimonas sp.]
MPVSKLRIVLSIACLLGAPLVHAQAQDALARAALASAERGEQASLPSSHPLQGWVEYAGLRRNVETLAPAQGLAFLQRYRDQPVTQAFRETWLASLARRADWTTFGAAWSPAITNTALRCNELEARLRRGGNDAHWTRDVQAVWRSGGSSLPDACDPPFAALAAQGGLAPALRWERIEKAVETWQPGVMRAAARGLPADELALANDYAAFLDTPHERALAWPKTPRSRLVASHGLAKLAKASPMAGEAQLSRYGSALGFTEADRGRVLYQAALWTVASYLPDSARLLNAVPASAFDERLHEWRVREALARSDWRAARDAIGKMGQTQREDSRWTYFAARTAELTGDKAGAQALYRNAARAPDFHGFLAADRIDQPYALCPWQPKDAPAASAAVANDPGMLR